ncbi:helix-turn-helix transcriptional regulator [Arabiibacter massiliensis]|uniref:helix-turn-helix transcriptional regulator n=1 Tax=Arabiibacter massiliensis TaxID=1870985 RepID=UPI0009BC08A9|nr:helix-turn-helix transcriptional regulator [Arabiibacter massiliensis]
MGFRENLQHLRETRTMTQSELAMLVGVSRQSVTKWEAEKSYPEMDKLIRLCELFECTIDDLVRGDLTGRAPDLARSMPEDAPPVDACGYDEAMRRFAWKLPAGLAMFVVGFGVAAIATSLFAANPSAYPYLAYLLCAAVGVGLAASACLGYRRFRREHPYIEDFYTEEQKAAARRSRKRGVLAGVALLAVALFLASTFMLAIVSMFDLWVPVMAVNWMTPFLFWLAIAASFALILHAFLNARRVNVARYNRAAERAADRDADLATTITAALQPKPAEPESD